MITTQFIKMFNKLANEPIVQARAVNTQTVGFSDWCIRMANGSTVTAADVSAVMQQIEDKLPEILSLNAKVICSPGGLTFRPKVSGSITQSQLRAKLEARKAAETDPEKAAAINVNRALTTSDLSISDCEATIEVELPRDWSDIFKKRAELKRVNRATTTDGTDGGGSGGDDNNDNNDNNGGGSGNDNSNNNDNNGGTTTNGTNTSSGVPQLTISRSGSGSSTVTVNGNAVSSGAEIAANTEVSISVTPAEGATPTATLNGSSVTLTESDGVYAGSFQMPSGNATLAINTGGASTGGGDAN